MHAAGQRVSNLPPELYECSQTAEVSLWDVVVIPVVLEGRGMSL